jgi:hypothetical protein
MTRDATAYTSAFNDFHFLDATEPPFGSAALDGATDVPGIDASRVTFDSQDIYVNFSGVTYSTGQQVSLDLQAAPEPNSFWLLLPISALQIYAAGRRTRLFHPQEQLGSMLRRRRLISHARGAPGSRRQRSVRSNRRKPLGSLRRVIYQAQRRIRCEKLQVYQHF